MKANVQIIKFDLPSSHSEVLARACPIAIKGNRISTQLGVDDPSLYKLLAAMRSLGYHVGEGDTDAPLTFGYTYTLSFSAKELRSAELYQLLPKHSVNTLLNDSSRGKYHITNLDSWDEGDLSRKALKQLMDGSLHAFDVAGQVTAVSDKFRHALEDAKLFGIEFEEGFEISSDLLTGKARPQYWLLKPAVALPAHSFVRASDLPGGKMLEELGFESDRLRYAMRCIPQKQYGNHRVDYGKTSASEDGDPEEAGIEIVSKEFKATADLAGAEFSWDTPVALC